jgi:hypothetical protein
MAHAPRRGAPVPAGTAWSGAHAVGTVSMQVQATDVPHSRTRAGGGISIVDHRHAGRPRISMDATRCCT